MKHNNSINCTVKKCKHHCHEDNFCTLDKICVGSQNNNPMNSAATDCNSFEPCCD